jgi:uncharacterized protein YrrD
MRKGSDIIGKHIVAYNTGSKIGRVLDLVFDQQHNAIVGLLVEEKGFFSDAKILPLSSIQSMGVDAVITEHSENIIPAKSNQKIAEIMEHNNVMKGTHIMTVSGQDLGATIDLYFDENTGSIEGYEVSGGIFADAYSGRSFVPAVQTLRIGEHYAFVPTIVAEMMEEQVGGIKAAMQTTSDRVHAAAKTATEKISEASRQTTTKLTNALVDPDSQQAFIIGRRTEADVLRPDGAIFMPAGKLVMVTDANSARALGILTDLYQATGGNLADDAIQKASELGQKVADKTSNAAQNITTQANATAARYTIDRALGRRASNIVRSRNGFIIAAPGQIVTEMTINRAKTYHAEEPLLKSVGLSTTTAAKSSMDDAFDPTTDKISYTADRVKSGADRLVDWAKDRTNRLRAQTAQTLEEQHIKGALGRPTMRVILDRQDGVILNTGELITHHAIEAARQEGVLDVLLASVYTKTPEFSSATLRAPEPGRAALPAINESQSAAA